MNTRMLGRTGLEVSEVGFGAWGIGKSERRHHRATRNYGTAGQQDAPHYDDKEAQ